MSPSPEGIYVSVSFSAGRGFMSSSPSNLFENPRGGLNVINQLDVVKDPVLGGRGFMSPSTPNLFENPRGGPNVITLLDVVKDPVVGDFMSPSTSNLFGNPRLVLMSDLCSMLSRIQW